MKRKDINIRDPFILLHNGTYYLYGTPGEAAWDMGIGFYVYTSQDLEDWSEPIKCFTPPEDFWANKHFWAPEVHFYQGKFYMFASFYHEEKMRAVEILRADRPEGPFTVFSGPVTPADWMCLDGTLYIENGVPYMVFCHEWLQIKDGGMCVIRLKDDLSGSVGEPRTLFHASETAFSKERSRALGGVEDYVTDGPFLYRTKEGKLLMLWSSFSVNGYIAAVAVSSNGSIRGEWRHLEKPFTEGIDGGHGMLFYSKEGELLFTMHSPNGVPQGERPRIYKVKEIPEEPYLVLGEELPI